MSWNFTREEFYTLVWSQPMTHLAKEFALSDVALHKVCRKHSIPTPPAGWWAKKAAGKKVIQAKLPKAQPGVYDKIIIAGGELRRKPDAVAAAREQARILASAPSPAAPARSYPIIERTLAKLRKAKAGPTGLVSTDEPSLIRCDVAPTSIERLANALPSIVDAAEQQSFRLAAGEKSACFIGNEQSIRFSITETVKRVQHELTDKERAEEEKWQRGCCQSNRNLSLAGAAIALRPEPQIMTFCHSANAAERRSL